MSDAEPRIDFYVLAGAEDQHRLHFACRLIEKAYRLEHQVVALTQDAHAAASFDELLWTFRDGSFVPHELLGTDNPASPVCIGHLQEEAAGGDLLVNLSGEVPSSFEGFKRVAEIVGGSETEKQAGRQRFSFYRDNGYPPTTHNVS